MFRIRIPILVVLMIVLVAVMVSAKKSHAGNALRNECFMSCAMKKGQRKSQFKKCKSLCAAIPKDSTLYDEEFQVESDSDNSGSLINQEMLWDMYRVEVLRAITKGSIANRPYLQLLTAPIDATWDTENPNVLQQIADKVPYWSDYYDASPFSISGQYKTFVNNINAGRTVKDQQSKTLADQYQREFEAITNRMQPAQMACWDRFAKEQPSGMTVEQYEQSRCPNVKSLREEASTKQALVIFFMTLAYGEEHQSLLESRSAASGSMTYREAGTTLKAFRTALARGVRNPLHVSVSGLSQTNRSKKFSEISTGLTRPSRLNGSQFQFLATKDGKGLSTRRDQFKLDIKFESYAAIRIVPDAWFRDSVLTRYKNGPFINGMTPLFGKSGTMRLRPTTIYVVYRPRFEMTMNKSDAFNFENAISKKSGGFFSKKSESSSIKTEVVNKDTMKVILESKNKAPQIIAIDNEFLG